MIKKPSAIQFIIAICFVMGCIPIKISTSPEKTVTTPKHDALYTVDQVHEIYLAPFYNRWLVEDIIDKIEARDREISITGSDNLWAILFPQHPLDIEVSLTELTTNKSRDAMLSNGIEFLVIIEKYVRDKQTKSWKLWPGSTIDETTECSWILIAIDNRFKSKAFHSESEGVGKVGLVPLPYLFVFPPYTDPATEQEVLNNLADQVVTEIRKTINGQTMISVLSGKF